MFQFSARFAIELIEGSPIDANNGTAHALASVEASMKRRIQTVCCTEASVSRYVDTKTAFEQGMGVAGAKALSQTHQVS